MEENFFEPGKRSHCLFSPDLWCDLYEPTTQPAPLDFLCDIQPQTVGVILPPGDGEEADVREQVYERIAQVWESRQVGFRCFRIDPDEWNQAQPCGACAITRGTQVVILDITENSARSASFREMANSSRGALEMFKAFSPLATIPSKRVILLSRKPQDVPPHYRRIFHWIDYGGPDGAPDLDLLTRRLEEIARELELFSAGEAIRLDLSDLEEETAEPQLVEDDLLSPPQAADAETPIEDLVRILDEPAAETPAAGPATPSGATADPLADAEQLLQRGDAAGALRRLLGASRVDGSTRRTLLEDCLLRATPSEAARAFLEAGYDVRLSAANGGPALLSFQEEAHEKSFGASEIPVYLLESLTAAKATEMYQEMKTYAGSPPTAVVIATRSDEPAGRRLLEAGGAQPPVRFLEIHPEDLWAQIRQGVSAPAYLRERLRTDYQREADLFLQGALGVGCDESETIGRAELRATLLEHLRSGGGFSLYGLPGSGKSCLLRCLAAGAEDEGVLPILIDLQKYPVRNVAELYYLTARATARTVEAIAPAHPLQLFDLPASASPQVFASRFADDMNALGQQVRRARGNMALRRLALLFDGVESPFSDPVRRIPGEDQWRPFFASLRTLSDRGLFVVGAASFGRAPQQAFGTADFPLHGLREHTLPGLSAAEVETLVRGIGRRMYCYFHDEAVAAIVRAGGGHPRLTRHICSAVLAAWGTVSRGPAESPTAVRREPVSADEVAHGVRSSLTTGSLRLRVARLFRSFAGQFHPEAEALEQMARVPSGETVALDWLTTEGKLEQGMVDNLCDHGLLDRVGRDRFRFRIGLLEDWLRQELAA